MDWEQMSTPEILAGLRRGQVELKRRGVIRTGNKPIAGLAEHLVCGAMNLVPAPNSTAGYDATDGLGLRYEIKSREFNGTASSRQLSTFHALPSQPFDLLVGVLFDGQGRVTRAIILPHAVVLRHARYDAARNRHILILKDDLWSCPEAKDVTAELRAAAMKLH